ncbi:hypothetical protein, partial [Streptomyces sp. TM32]|uniref:hypothetical protein n=1 Tax=Streptomyces sp. TM32 TaxID=1652669 RepID=UPI001C209C84
MKGTTSGRHDPFAPCGTREALTPLTPTTPITLRNHSTSHHSTDPMHHRPPHANRPAPTDPR